MSRTPNPNLQSTTCPACGGVRLTPFYEMSGAPAHSVLLMPTREAALAYPRGDIHLALCEDCGFITNTAFDPSLHEYSERYEETQGFSPTFGAFHRALAQRLIDRYDLRHKTILEIGCGKGEFLTMLCQMGDNRGVGFDPAYIPERNAAADDRITFIRDFYSEQYADYQADFVVCKMTLEHIPDVGISCAWCGGPLATIASGWSSSRSPKSVAFCENWNSWMCTTSIAPISAPAPWPGSSAARGSMCWICGPIMGIST
jgi:SAM-dependent methyltransferase